MSGLTEKGLGETDNTHDLFTRVTKNKAVTFPNTGHSTKTLITRGMQRRVIGRFVC